MIKVNITRLNQKRFFSASQTQPFSNFFRFLEHEIRIILEKKLERFQAFNILQF
jgi:hypothetical protein